VEAAPATTLEELAVSVTAGSGERLLPVKRAHPVRRGRSSPGAPVHKMKRRNMRAYEFIMGSPSNLLQEEANISEEGAPRTGFYIGTLLKVFLGY
jgi:hypothetical protein